MEVEMYLFVYKVEGVEGLVKKLASVSEIAKTIGCRDFNETYAHRVYQVNNDGVWPLEIRDCSKYHTVTLLTRYDHVVAEGEYPEH